MTRERSGEAGRPPRPRTARSRSAVAPSTSGGVALGELLAELEPDREHRVREVADVDAGQVAAIDRAAMSASSSPSPAGSTASPKRSRIVPRLRRRNANVTGSATMNSKNARKPLSRKSSAPGGRAPGGADAAARLGAELLDDRPEHRLLVREVVVERARGERRGARRCRARRPRRSRGRRTARGRPRGSRCGWRPWCARACRLRPSGEATANLTRASSSAAREDDGAWIRRRRRSRRRAAWCGAGGRAASRSRSRTGRTGGLVAAEGQARPGRDLGAGRAARGRGGDRLPLQARPRAPAPPPTATRRAARRSCATG